MIKLTKIGWEIFYTTSDTTERDYLEKCLSYYNENVRFSKSDYWDGYVRFYDKRKKCFNFGHLAYIITKLESKKIDYIISNVDFEIFHPKLKYNKELRPHQLASLYSFFQTKFGIIKVPTRGGKTYIASEAIRLINHSQKGNVSLFIVDSVTLFNQAIKDISEYLKIPKTEIGFIRDGKWKLQQINVITIQTIEAIFYGHKRIKKTKKLNGVITEKTKIELRDEKKLKVKLKKDLLEFFTTVGFLTVDECHCYTSEDRIDIIKSIPNSEFNLFLSATPFKSENKFANIALRGLAADILYEIPEQDLKKKGYLAEDRIILIRINHDKNKNIDLDGIENYFDAIDKLIVANKERNQIAVNVIEICRKFLLKILVLFVYKQHGKNISIITSDPHINGDNNQNYIQEITEDFLAKKDGGVLLASNIFNKGITLPEVEVMLNIGGGKEQSGVIQKKGRVLGVTKDKKKAMIIDFIDENSYFIEHSLSRLEVYEESVGIANIAVFSANDPDFYSDLREYINQWFNEGI